MTNKQLFRRFLVVLALSACVGGNALGAAVQFDFGGDLNATLGPGTLEYHNGATTSDAVSFGTAGSFGLPALPGGEANVMSFPAFAPDQGLLLGPAAGPNGGGDYINQYTMIWDLLLPDVSAGWFGFYNTNATNSNDGDFFIRPDGGIGIGGVYEGTVNSNQWHRIAMVWDVDSMYKYIDGTLVGSQIDISGVDGRWSMYTTAHDVDTFLLTDDSGDTNSGYINSFYFTDEALVGSAIAAFGGADVDGVIPEPTTLMLLALGASLLSTRKRRGTGRLG